MIRPLHRWFGILAALAVCVLALSGAALAVFPAAEAIGTASTPAVDVGTFATRVAEAVPGLEEIRRAPSGRITAYTWVDGVAAKWVVDPATGAPLAPVTPSATELWLTNLHRAFLAGDAGRIAAAATSLVMLVLTLTGFALAARRMGGWRRVFGPLRGRTPHRLHLELARVAGAGLLISSLTGLWLFAVTFGLVPDQSPVPAFPQTSGTTAASPADLAALGEIPLASLRDLTFPRAGDPGDVFTVETDAGLGYVDQGTGEMLAFAGRTTLSRVSEFVAMLHTGRGLALFGVLFGLAALTVPVLTLTGLLQQRGRASRPKARRQTVAADAADTIILVGSEGGTTWTFAESLRAGLARAGSPAHVAAMAEFAPERYRKASRILILAATSGSGHAPSSAKGFLERVAALSAPPAAPFAVLGFGDSAFPTFCAYAERVAAAARAMGWDELVPFARVDRQSEADFTRWTRSLATAMETPVEIEHRALEPVTAELTLLSRRDYGAEVQAPTAILRFALPRRTLWQRLAGKGFGPFQAGDLLGIVPAGDSVPRYYSLASARRDGFAEICVRKHPGGLCSGQLMELQPGDTVRAFLRPNPAFHPAADRTPLVLVGAGTGIGPFAGFARANRALRPIHLYFGTRSPDSDLLYGDELARWQADGRLARVVTAFSRTKPRTYVQDALRRDGEALGRLLEDGARIMVCGGRDMATGVAAALEEIVAPLGLTLGALKAEGRYVEDVY